MRNIIAGEDDITSHYLNDSGERVEDLERRNGSSEGMEGEDDGSNEETEGEDDGSGVGTLVTKSGEVYKLSRC
jgi:hypothetical protein